VVDEAADDTAEDIYVVVAGLTSDNDNRNNLTIAGSASGIDLLTWNFLCNDSDSCVNTTASVEYAVEVSKADSSKWSTLYPGLADGTYYFHVKAKDVAGNWGDTAHYRIDVAAGGVSVAIVYPEDGEVVTTGGSEANISVKVAVTGNSSAHVVARHPDGSIHTSADYVFSTVHIFDNITMELGTNEIYAVANTSAGAVTQSSSVYVIVSRDVVPTTGKTLRVGYSGCGQSGGGFICYAAVGGNYIGMANEDPASIAAGTLQADTTHNSVKIFFSNPFSTSSMDDYMRDNEFLDQANPSFSYAGDRKDFLVQNELRYEDVFIAGGTRLQPGKYNLYITHNGVTEDGKVNLSITVQ
jgi:hypothetical protein